MQCRGLIWSNVAFFHDSYEKKLFNKPEKMI